MALPTAIYTSAQVRALDEHAITQLGIPGYTLMKRAGEAALRYLRSRWPMAHRIVIVCGGGNNGGDGYVLARFAQASGLQVTTLAAVAAEKLHGDAKQAHDDFVASGGYVEPFSAERLEVGEVIVDALLGTGVRGLVREHDFEVIRAINESSRARFSLDIPSGLDPDLGIALGNAVRADATVTFVGLKSGLFVGDGPEFTGSLYFDDLEVAAPHSTPFTPVLARITEAEITEILPPRRRSAHKGSFGRVLIVGSGPGMPGATRLAGDACLRVGAGLVTVAVASENIAAIAAGRPELICHPCDDAATLGPLIAQADVVAIGPGLGRSAWARDAFARVLASDKPLVIDADALNLLAESAGVPSNPLIRPARDWILTPHPGEAARLLQKTNAEIQEDRLGSCATLVAKYGGVVVLKGAGTIVGASGRPAAICERGNPGMATAGMGDVLTGAIAGIYAQCRDGWRAARVGVLVHALAGDAAARDGERGLLASDLMRELRTWVNR